MRAIAGTSNAKTSESERGGLVPGLLMVILALVLALCALSLVARSAAGAATLPPGFEQKRVASDISKPTTMAFAPDGRLFVAEQTGRLRVINRRDDLVARPFIDLSRIVASGGERGLLGVAFDPNFRDNQYVYLYFTRNATATQPVHNRIVRFTADGNEAVPGSGKLILRLNNLSEDKLNHNGGALHFGEEGKLYVAVGENANPKNAQSFKNLLGKMLRINKNGSIPKDNPFYDREGVKGKNKAIWARGLRNPYTFAVRPGEGTIFINDVGQQTWEEINRGVAGANYGWPYYEGSERFEDSPPPPAGFQHRKPIYSYRQDNTRPGGECAITGGTFYNPQTVQFPARYVGDYFFADFCAGWIRTYDPGTQTVSNFAKGASLPVDLKVDHAGRLYYLERGSGSVYRVEHPGG